jgi:WD40 repeat protein
VRWAPSGDVFCSASSDKTVVFYDPKTGQNTSTLDKTGAHSGTIFSCAWNPESSKLLTASGDKTVTVGGAIEDQQLSALWPSSDLALTVSLNGTINYISTNDDSTVPVQQVHGHNAPIYRVIYCQKTNKFYSCGSEGILIEYEYGTSKTRLISGKFEKSSFTVLALADGELVVASLDGNLRFVNLDKFTLDGEAIKLNGTPSDIAVTSDGETLLVACHNGVQVINKKKVVGFTQTKYEPTCLSISPDDKHVVVGGGDKKIHLCDLKKDGVAETKTFEDKHGSKLTSIKYSPDGKLIASGDSGREIVVWDTSDNSAKYTQLTYHTSAITEMSWSADSSLMVSGSTDGNVIVWDFANAKRISQSCHPQGTKSVQFINSNTVMSAGADFRIRSFSVSWEKK